MSSKPCKFCAELRSLKEINAEERSPFFNLMHKYSVALVDRVYRDSTPGGTTTYYGHKLNYCPQCGRNLRKEIRK